eukprot:gene9821-18394_t
MPRKGWRCEECQWRVWESQQRENQVMIEKGKEKRSRRTGSDTLEFLNEKIKIDIEGRSWQREREEKRLTSIESQLERQNEMLAQINVQLQHQNSLIVTLMQHFNATQ